MEKSADWIWGKTPVTRDERVIAGIYWVLRAPPSFEKEGKTCQCGVGVILTRGQGCIFFAFI